MFDMGRILGLYEACWATVLRVGGTDRRGPHRTCESVDCLPSIRSETDILVTRSLSTRSVSVFLLHPGAFIIYFYLWVYFRLWKVQVKLPEPSDFTPAWSNKSIHSLKNWKLQFQIKRFTRWHKNVHQVLPLVLLNSELFVAPTICQSWELNLSLV